MTHTYCDKMPIHVPVVQHTNRSATSQQMVTWQCQTDVRDVNRSKLCIHTKKRISELWKLIIGKGFIHSYTTICSSGQNVRLGRHTFDKSARPKFPSSSVFMSQWDSKDLFIHGRNWPLWYVLHQLRSLYRLLICMTVTATNNNPLAPKNPFKAHI